MKSNVGNKGDSVKTKKTMKRWDKGGSGKKENKWDTGGSGARGKMVQERTWEKGRIKDRME